MNLVGRKIVEQRRMTEEELNAQGWDEDGKTTCLVFDDGSKIFASQDDEGNGPGNIFGVTKEGKSVYVWYE